MEGKLGVANEFRKRQREEKKVNKEFQRNCKGIVKGLMKMIKSREAVCPDDIPVEIWK